MYAGKNIVNNNNIGLYKILLFAKHFHILFSVVLLVPISVAFGTKVSC